MIRPPDDATPTGHYLTTVREGCSCVMTSWTARDSSGAPTSPPEWEQADDCPVHPRFLFCEECDVQQVVVEESVEASGYEEQQREWLVTRLDCGHEIATRVVAGVGG